MSIGFSQNQFVAFSLLAHRPRRENIYQIKHIWIDTSSISQYIESLIYYISKFNDDNFRTLQYHSFQSYGDDTNAGYKNNIPDLKDNVWVIISASRSNDMGVDIYDTWKGIKHDQIITLLSYTDSKKDQKSLSFTERDNPEFPARPGDNIVVNISQFSDCHSTEKKYGSEIPVKIIGENFTAQVEKPNTVLFRKIHGPEEVSKFVEHVAQSNFLLTHKNKYNRLRSIYFDFVRFRNSKSNINDDYLSWLKDIVHWYITSSVAAIIYDFNDEPSKILFNDINTLIDSPSIIEVDINGDINIDPDRPIIALLPVMSCGNSFIKLNSDLRLVGHSSQRILNHPGSVGGYNS